MEETEEQFMKRARREYDEWVQRCHNWGVPITTNFESYCFELLSVQRVEEKEPPVVIYPPSHEPRRHYSQYVSPRGRETNES